MTVIGLTGGIGSGKSTVAEFFRQKGAAVFDADDFARDAVAIGSDGLAAVVLRFGEQVLLDDGSLDRAAVAKIVFHDKQALRDLEAIIHPIVYGLTEEAIADARATRELTFYVSPLPFGSSGRARLGLSALIVVDVPPELAIERLVSFREMDEQDARARIAAQPTRADRLVDADYVIVNIGSLKELAAMSEAAWKWALEYEAS